MLKLLIVDDERYVADHVAQLFEGLTDPEYDVYRAYSSQEALAITEKIKIDIAILDIHMPILSGLELARRLQERWQQCHVIFLTAFDDFDNIYVANKITNSTFLLKTETDETIRGEALKHARQIQRRLDENALLDQAKSSRLMLRQLAEQSILYELCFGSAEDTLRSLESAPAPSLALRPDRLVYLVQMRFSPPRAAVPGAIAAWMPYLECVQSLACDLFRFSMLKMGDHAALWLFQPLENAEALLPPFTYLRSMLEDFIELSRVKTGRRVTMSLYPTEVAWTRVAEVWEAMNRESAVIWNQPWTDSAVAVLRGAGAAHPGREAHPVGALLAECKKSLLQNAKPAFDDCLEQCQREYFQAMSTFDMDAIYLYYGILMALTDEIRASGLLRELPRHMALSAAFHLSDQTGWSGAVKRLRRLADLFFALNRQRRESYGLEVIAAIKAYIQKNYASEITLYTLAELVSYNESHVSRIFKQATGMGVMEYLSQVRIDRAKELLATTSGSIQTVAERAGFHSSQYFSNVFKKRLGLSPAEYRRRLALSKDER